MHVFATTCSWTDVHLEIYACEANRLGNEHLSVEAELSITSSPLGGGIHAA